MTAYTFVPTSSTQNANWNDPSKWAGGVVPNSADADVSFPAVTVVSSSTPYISTVTIASGENFSVRSIDLNDNLAIKGVLNVSGGLTNEQYGFISLSGGGTLNVAGTLAQADHSAVAVYAGTLTAGAITAATDASVSIAGGALSATSLTNIALSGHGTVTVGNFSDANGIAVSGDLSVTASNFSETGPIGGTGELHLHTQKGGSTVLAGGVWSGNLGASYSGTVFGLDAGSVINTDNGTITLAGGVLTSRDPTTGQDIALTTSLQTIGASGTLNILDGVYQFDTLSVLGQIILGYPSSAFPSAESLAVTGLTIAAGGQVHGAGSLAGAIVNNGTITADTTSLTFDLTGSHVSQLLKISGTIAGDGTLAIGASHAIQTGDAFFTQAATAELELAAATNETVVFNGNGGTLHLDSPATFTGSIVTDSTGGTYGSGDTILLDGLSLAANPTVHYAGDASGGTLTLQGANGPISLKFLGHYTAGDFILSAGPQVGGLSSDPPSLMVTITAKAITTAHDFNGDGLADILWRSSSGLVTNWLSSGTGANDDPGVQRQVGLDWHIQGTGDFNGDGRTDILWRNDNGTVTDWLASGTGYADNPAVMRSVGSDWTVAGTGDFNGDGKTDVLWRNANGTVTDWLSDGQALNDNSVATRAVGSDWHVMGTGDFNGDGKTDVLWENDSGLVTDWLSTTLPAQSTASAATTVFADDSAASRQVGSGWKIVGTGDFDGNGKTDILWQNTAGLVTVWQSDGTHFNDGPTFTRQAGLDWHIMGTGDYNGDGRTDVLWQSDAGVVTEWLSTPSGFVDDPLVMRQVGSSWSIFVG